MYTLTSKTLIQYLTFWERSWMTVYASNMNEKDTTSVCWRRSFRACRICLLRWETYHTVGLTAFILDTSYTELPSNQILHPICSEESKYRWCDPIGEKIQLKYVEITITGIVYSANGAFLVLHWTDIGIPTLVSEDLMQSTQKACKQGYRYTGSAVSS